VRNEKGDLLTGMQALLRYHSSLGIKHYPRDENIEVFLRALPSIVRKKSIAQQENVVGGETAQPKKRPVTLPSPIKISEIAEEVAGCRACDLHQQRLYPVAGDGSEKIRLLIVGDWLSADERGGLPAGHIFGVLQDEMLSRMLLAINLSADEVFITNVIKCAVPAACQPQAAHVQSCLSFLRRQIVALRPEVICTMGMVTARAVLQRSQPLSKLRGQFHEYTIEKDWTIPVIATYHPTYLLQNPEMKQATWADLQLLAKRMGLMPGN
jgi:DNA polymerase